MRSGRSIDEVLTQLRLQLRSTNYLGGFLYPTTNPLNLKLPVFFLTIRGDEKGVCLMYDFVRVRGIRLLSYHLSISGVFKPDGAQYTSLEHSPRDFLPVEKSYQEPTLTTSNVLKAVQTIFRKENWPVLSEDEDHRNIFVNLIFVNVNIWLCCAQLSLLK